MFLRTLFSHGLIAGMLIQALAPSVAQAAYPKIYPFVPMSAEELHSRANNFTEDPNYISNIYQMQHAGSTKTQPWMSTFWPLNKGLIADSYSTSIGWNPFRYHREVSWQANHQRILKRVKEVHARWHELKQDELNVLAPSEKYDLLLGDTRFTLTHKLRDYMYKWGSKKEFGYLTNLNIVGGGSLDLARQMVNAGQFSNVEDALPLALQLRGGLADQFAAAWVNQGKYRSFEQALPYAISTARNESRNYELEDKTVLMGLWEGICHGWSTAAGIVPRPTGTATFRLPNGKYLNFYPDDIKGLISLMWANSLIQDALIVDGTSDHNTGGGVIMEGLRCNDPNPATDAWGRFYDSKPDKYSEKLESRCAGVHPATWHLALVNLIGKQGRSFVVERKISEKIDNHPMNAYSSKFFNPYTGRYGSLESSIQPLTEKDQFFSFRSPLARKIVGVKTAMTYIDWARPKRNSIDRPEMDKKETIEMLYDLELDEQGNVVGGQWRTTEVGKPKFLLTRTKRTMPDFFWVITKNWKKFFPENTQISQWKNLSSPPPGDWLPAAKLAADFVYQQTHDYGFNQTCKVVNKKTDKVVNVPCEFKISKPQPLVNVVNTLLKISRGEL